MRSSSVEETCNVILANNLSPEMLTLEYNVSMTRAKVIFEGANIQVTNFIGIDNAKKFINEVRKRYYRKSKDTIKSIK